VPLVANWLASATSRRDRVVPPPSEPHVPAPDYPLPSKPPRGPRLMAARKATLVKVRLKVDPFTDTLK
jgi:hypothetical protein